MEFERTAYTEEVLMGVKVLQPQLIPCDSALVLSISLCNAVRFFLFTFNLLSIFSLGSLHTTMGILGTPTAPFY